MELGVTLDVLLVVLILRVLTGRMQLTHGGTDLDDLRELQRLMTALLWIPLLVPAALALASALRRRRRLDPHGRPRRRDRRPRHRAGPARHRRGSGPLTGAGGLLRADGLSAWLVTTIGAVAVTALWGGLPGAPTGASRTAATRRWSACSWPR